MAAQQAVVAGAAVVTPAVEDMSFPSVTLAPSPPRLHAASTCIGQPGPLDLETSEPNVATGCVILHHSTGAYRVLAKGQDPQDNSEIGALEHDCRTYWGHSGAPLFDVLSQKAPDEKGDGDAVLVGLHLSWEEQSGMRRRVAWEAVRAFLDEHTVLVGIAVCLRSIPKLFGVDGSLRKLRTKSDDIENPPCVPIASLGAQW
ncbi:hypothetical protein LTR65_006187 [Meristemomyces frigidus]